MKTTRLQEGDAYDSTAFVAYQNHDMNKRIILLFEG